MATLRKVLLLLAFACFVLIAAVFAYGNRESVALDIGFVRLESVSLAGAFVVAFVVGAVFGMACASLAYVKATAEKRNLRRRLSAAETELGRLRSAPIQNAD